MKYIKYLLVTVVVLFVVLNISAAFHGYKFTHFDEASTIKTKVEVEDLTILDKLDKMFFGVTTPRPTNNTVPDHPFEVVNLTVENEQMEAWYVPRDSAIGTIIICHGYAGDKESMLPRGEVFYKLGYNLFLIDFRGSGGSFGNATSIGYYEGEEVKAAYDYIAKKTSLPIYLQGTSMGAVAIMKAMFDHHIEPKAIILECPFASLLQTSINRFGSMGVPSFPAAHLLVFWGGIERGFNGFHFEPSEYAKWIHVPTLLVYGEQDPRVKRFEIDLIQQNLHGEKSLLSLPKSAHANYLDVEYDMWFNGVKTFLDQH